MKKLIFLKIDLTQIPDEFASKKFVQQEKLLIEQTVKDFKKQIKDFAKVVKDYLPDPQILIEFDDDQYYPTIYDALCQMNMVDVIDSNISVKSSEKEPNTDQQNISELKSKLAKYTK
jgi:hypothetical protein